MKEINQMIDHTILKANATKEEVLQVIEEAKKYQFYSVCIQPCWVALAREHLSKEKVAVCTVIGFPLGANTTETKEFEAKNAIRNGADELDMVINIGLLKSGDKKSVQHDIEVVCRAAKGKALVKVIIETALLTKQEITDACELSMNAGADFVKTSTGFSIAGAKIEDIALMSQTVEAKLGVKASGGIHNLADAKAMIEAGATRIGTSSGVAIMQELL